MSESIGAALRTRREQRKLTLQQVTEATRIRVHYLQALENGDISAMPSTAQARGFLGIYAKFLELDLEALIRPPAEQTSAEAPSVPRRDAATSPSAPAPLADPHAKTPGLLSTLRDRLVRRLGNTAPPAESKEAAGPEPGLETDGKKKALP